MVTNLAETYLHLLSMLVHDRRLDAKEGEGGGARLQRPGAGQGGDLQRQYLVKSFCLDSPGTVATVSLPLQGKRITTMATEAHST